MGLMQTTSSYSSCSTWTEAFRARRSFFRTSSASSAVWARPSRLQHDGMCVLAGDREFLPAGQMAPHGGFGLLPLPGRGLLVVPGGREDVGPGEEEDGGQAEEKEIHARSVLVQPAPQPVDQRGGAHQDTPQ